VFAGTTDLRDLSPKRVAPSIPASRGLRSNENLIGQRATSNPANTGNTHYPKTLISFVAFKPRKRGEYRKSAGDPWTVSLQTPQTRGILQGRGPRPASLPSTPANRGAYYLPRRLPEVAALPTRERGAGPTLVGVIDNPIQRLSTRASRGLRKIRGAPIRCVPSIPAHSGAYALAALGALWRNLPSPRIAGPSQAAVCLCSTRSFHPRASRGLGDIQDEFQAERPSIPAHRGAYSVAGLLPQRRSFHPRASRGLLGLPFRARRFNPSIPALRGLPESPDGGTSPFLPSTHRGAEHKNKGRKWPSRIGERVCLIPGYAQRGSMGRYQRLVRSLLVRSLRPDDL